MAAASLLMTAGCSDRSTPSSPSAGPWNEIQNDDQSGAGASRLSDAAAYARTGPATEESGATSDASSSSEAIDCTHLQKRNVRFSDPGYVRDNVVGLFYNFEGVPAGPAMLEIYWDEENHPDVSERVFLGDGEIQRNDDNKSDHTGVVQHVYAGVTRSLERTVRANLISNGRMGNCATVRRVTVTPGAVTADVSSDSGVDAGFTGSKTQLGRIFRDGVPSTCAGKAYPGIFAPSTTFNYENYRYTAVGAGIVCVRVNFQPLTGSPSECGNNAHINAYTAPYDPTDQSAGYLGDSGLSTTISFEFPVPAGTQFDLVVTNTTVVEACDYAFTVENAIQ
jgi:hypothetical protein